jgi:hypothetical protein
LGPPVPATVNVLAAIGDVVHHLDGTTDIRYEVTFTLSEV